jgi:hypothetical protein
MMEAMPRLSPEAEFQIRKAERLLNEADEGLRRRILGSGELLEVEGTAT